jgi:hypothetical protein
MNTSSSSLSSSDNSHLNSRLLILDPLSVIIKLVVLSYKPIGTKIFISNNILYLHDPGLFQGISRYILKTNKTDLQYIYNPIQIACQTFLSKEYISKNPKIKDLFIYAKNGIERLIETYKKSSCIVLCLRYFISLISNYVDQIYNENIFHKDEMTKNYTKDITDKLNSQWTTEKIKIISFLAE